MKSFLFALGALLGLSTSAAAQTEAAPLFVTAGFFAGIERFSHSKTITPTSFSTDFSGTTTGGNIGIGTFLAPRWSVRLELTFPSELEATFSPPTDSTGSPLVITQQFRINHRTKSGAVLLGYHTPARGRVSVEYLAGMAFIWERHGTVAELTARLLAPIPIPIPILPSRTESNFFTYRGAATLGVDVNLAMTSHFSVVPEIRAHVFTGSLSVRPGVGVRWTF